MKLYSGVSVEEILETVAHEEGIDKSLIHYHIVEENSEEVSINIFKDEDVIEFITDYIETFFDNLGQTSYVDARYSDGMYRIFVNASNNAVVIGKEGATLQAFTNVVRSAVNAHFKKHIKIVMDVNNYKANRYEKVESLVYRVAREVQESKISATLDFMPSDERRVVHSYLSGMENIKTESTGEGSERRLIIHYVEDEEN